MASHRIPRTIDDMPYAFIWRMDEFAVPILLLLVGMLVNHPFSALGIGFVLVYFYRKFREGRPNLFVLHQFYWWGFYPLNGHSMLNSYEREYWS
jgi:type IV conjugative transfer system protein TraL